MLEVIQPPAAMGSGHRGVSHKCGLLSYGWGLLVGPPVTGLRRFSQSYVSHTSDMGAELSIPDFSCTDPVRLLPEWMVHMATTKPN